MSLESWLKETEVEEEITFEEVEETTTTEEKLRLKGVYLVSADYDPDRSKVVLKFYDPKTEKIFLWYDCFNHKPYCYSKEDVEALKRKPEISQNERIVGLDREERLDPITDRKISVTKIVAADPLAIGGTRVSLREKLRVWEADIKYYLNYLIDMDLQIGIPYDVTKNKITESKLEMDPVATEIAEKVLKDVENKEEYEKWLKILSAEIPVFKRVAFDLEVFTEEEIIPSTSKADQPILAASFYGSDGLKKVLIHDIEGKLTEDMFKDKEYEVEIFRNEKSMIARIMEILEQYPFVITFNGDNFDFPYLYHRAIRLGFRKEDIPIKLGRNDARIIWGIHIDLYKFFFNKSVKSYAFKNRYDIVSLEEVSEALLGEGKVKLEEIVSKVSPSLLADYSFTDGKLTYELTSFNNDLVMKLITIIARISNMTLEDVCRLAVSNWIKNRLIQMHREKRYLIPLKDEIKAKGAERFTEPITKGKKYIGAVVVQPKPGVFFNVVVMDFASLYPSIIKEYNISYETVRCLHPECKDNIIPGTPHWVCKRKRGLMSEFVGIIRDLRVRVFKKLAKDQRLSKNLREFYDVVQGALKVIINASYGVFGSEAFPFYYLPAAESVTMTGRNVITKTIEYCRKLGLDVIYGDTDSLFLHNPPENKLDELVKFAKREFKLDLEVDKVYRYVAFSVRKKNYFGVLTNGQIDVKGLVGKKRNTPKLIKDAFFKSLEVLREVYTPEEFEKAKEQVKKIYFDTEERLKKREFTLDEVAISVVLGKRLEDYTSTTPEHVKAAKLLQTVMNREVKPGEVIRYVKTRGRLGVKPIEGASEKLIREIDVKRYIELLKSTFEQLMDAIGIDLEREVRGVNRLESFM